MRRLCIVLLLLGAGSVVATDRPPLGYATQAGSRLDIIDQKSIWSATRRTVTVYLLDCPYRAELLERWTQREPYLTCRRVSSKPTELVVKLVFHFSETHQLEQLELHTSSEPYRPGFRHVWASDFPVENLAVEDGNELRFDADIALPTARLRVVLHRRA